MISIKTPAEIARMRTSGHMAAQVLEALATGVSPGMTTAELDAYAEECIRKLGARSAFLGYRNYPGHVCISVNDEVVHGIPGPRRIEEGDVVSLDVGVEYDGFMGDTATTVLVGVSDERLLHLAATGRRALELAIERAVAGARLSDISHIVEQTTLREGFSVVRDFCGHGIGRNLHEEPQIPNYGPPGRGPVLRPGMTLAIEPMLNGGSAAVQVLSDGWTVRTKDGHVSVHFEHTVAIRESGPAEVLTCR